MKRGGEDKNKKKRDEDGQKPAMFVQQKENIARNSILTRAPLGKNVKSLVSFPKIRKLKH